MSEFLSEYFEALERLKQGKPIRISASTKITNDSVALEAGRNKGAIKKSRIIFSDLIVAIEIAAKEQKDLSVDQRKIFKLQEEVKNIRKDLENALGRELSLLYENYQLKKQLNTFTELDNIPIRGADSEKL